MAKTIVVAILQGVQQISQVAGSGEGGDYAVAKIRCRFIYKGDPHDVDLQLKQVTGSTFDLAHNLELARPDTYKGPFDYNTLSNAVNQYYKAAVGPEAAGIRIAPGATNITMNNNT